MRATVLHVQAPKHDLCNLYKNGFLWERGLKNQFNKEDIEMANKIF